MLVCMLPWFGDLSDVYLYSAEGGGKFDAESERRGASRLFRNSLLFTKHWVPHSKLQSRTVRL